MRVLLFFLILFPIATVMAQVKGDLIKENNPIIGTWRSADSINGSPNGVPLFDEDEKNEYCHFNANEDPSWFASFLDPENGFACPSYFVAHIKKDVVEGKHTGNCVVMEIGKIITFKFDYKNADDVLTIIFKDKKYRYKRFKV